MAPKAAAVLVVALCGAYNPALADPRLQWTRTGLGFDNTSPQYNWLGSGARDAALPIGKGEEARLIEAEAALAAGDVTTWLAKLNGLRTTVAGLTPLTDPGTAAGRIDLLFSERGFWLYGTGDMRFFEDTADPDFTNPPEDNGELVKNIGAT